MNFNQGNCSERLPFREEFPKQPLYKQGESAAQLAREYGIGYSTVHKWIQGQAKTQSGKSPDEIKAMEKRLTSLSEENEILKKALGFLAQK
ncbi:transposase [Lacticaseibacillus nasuensis]|uniref:transposase n=1 Tax=Lacticaseibacillus nasuensis TaxID=944671 RepID=UPI00224609D8|nr:transposase [Lacticaseibacillus nasuensis]MCX2455045.1 helix-turn-helix domain-containing protein [Lacticaseibacillus nasuensis]